ncbi:MAG TPA: hypothetical protein IGS52_24480 [Oscillatoriaceae cyanobacterium M33_DOE_052]|uniref:Uncharacterized protein n=1 Tax=Planktothricoides sp. SpSt-374 TaxID=2282167 RepID=A0A7C3VLL6_9CYAN|nr:hypothetical protein [Oscillatoriaceae cyanobacterium M33_DOE_052]
MTIQNRAIAIKFDAYLSQEKSLNAQLEADLKHITQAANQVTESGTFDWQLPPLEAAGELAESLKMMEAMQLAAERVREIVLTLKNFSRVDEGVAQPSTCISAWIAPC